MTEQELDPNYPSWRYHKTLGARIINSKAEEEDGWVKSPAEVDVPAKKAEKPVKEPAK